MWPMLFRSDACTRFSIAVGFSWAQQFIVSRKRLRVCQGDSPPTETSHPKAGGPSSQAALILYVLVLSLTTSISYLLQAALFRIWSTKLQLSSRTAPFVISTVGPA